VKRLTLPIFITTVLWQLDFTYRFALVIASLPELPFGVRCHARDSNQNSLITVGNNVITPMMVPWQQGSPTAR